MHEACAPWYVSCLAIVNFLHVLGHVFVVNLSIVVHTLVLLVKLGVDNVLASLVVQFVLKLLLFDWISVLIEVLLVRLVFVGALHLEAVGSVSSGGEVLRGRSCLLLDCHLFESLDFTLL